jgi:hypothetical protein
MRSVGRQRAVAAVLTVALCSAGGLAAGAGAKKKGKKAGPFAATKVANAAIPNPAAVTTSIPVLSTITVPKKYKGKVVGDVNLTGLQTTGNAAGASDDLAASLSAPNGRTIDLFVNVGGPANQSLGPWTIDDDTSTSICGTPAATPCADPTQTLHPPFAGTSNTIRNFNQNFPVNGPMASFDGVPMRGTWTLRIFDLIPAGATTSTLNQWGLRIRPAKPVKG